MHSAVNFYIPKTKHFAIEQGGRRVNAVNGEFKIARRPFTIVHDGHGVGQAIAAMTSESLNFICSNIVPEKLVMRTGDGVARDPGDLLFVSPYGVELCRDEDAKTRFARLISSDGPALLDDIFRKNPDLSVALAVPRIHLKDNKVEFSSLESCQFNKVPKQVLHITTFRYLEAFRRDSTWDWFYIAEIGGFPLVIE